MRLSTLLEETGIDPKAKWLLAEGADALPPALVHGSASKLGTRAGGGGGVDGAAAAAAAASNCRGVGGMMTFCWNEEPPGIARGGPKTTGATITGVCTEKSDSTILVMKAAKDRS